MSLETEIREWDRKSAKAITEIHAAHAAEQDLIDQLLVLAAATELETGATWLIKHQLENHSNRLNFAQTHRLIELLPSLSDWEAKLHCLQIFPFITLPAKQRELILQFVLDCSQDRNKFLRAWAYSGLHQLALAHPEYRDEARMILQTAEKHESAPSVRVRLRRVLKQGFPGDQA